MLSGRRYESQMQYGSIGWSVGASLGFSVGARSKGKRLITFVGDGCFQIGAQVRGPAQGSIKALQHAEMEAADSLQYQEARASSLHASTLWPDQDRSTGSCTQCFMQLKDE